MKLRILRFSLALILLASTILISGCGREADTEAIIQGWISANSPISDAELTIVNTRGKQIYDSNGPITNDSGSFLVAVKNLPTDFRIIASGGNCEGEPFSVDLSADYRDFDAKIGVIHVHTVTTLVSTYLDKHSGITLEEAQNTVKSYLEIPEQLDIGSGLGTSGQYFNHTLFVDEANNNGGVIAYIDQMADDLDNGGTHPFPVNLSHIPTGSENGLLGGVGPGVTGYVIDKLAGGAVSWAGG